MFIYFLLFLFHEAICHFEGATAVQHGLTLHLGDLVEITQTHQGDFFYFLIRKKCI